MINKKPKKYFFTPSFFDNAKKNPKILYEVFKNCMSLLDVPLTVSLVFNDIHPKGVIVVEKIDEENIGIEDTDWDVRTGSFKDLMQDEEEKLKCQSVRL